MFNLAVDLLLVVLLVVGISFAWLLNKRLRALHADRATLEALVQSLAETSMTAEAGISALRRAAAETGAELQKKIERAQSLNDDLGYLLDRGSQLADRLEEGVRSGRDVDTRPGLGREKPALAAVPAAPAAAKSGARTVEERMVAIPSRVERELKRVLEARRG